MGNSHPKKVCMTIDQYKTLIRKEKCLGCFVNSDGKCTSILTEESGKTNLSQNVSHNVVVPYNNETSTIILPAPDAPPLVAPEAPMAPDAPMAPEMFVSAVPIVRSNSSPFATATRNANFGQEIKRQALRPVGQRQIRPASKSSLENILGRQQQNDELARRIVARRKVIADDDDDEF